MLSIVIRLVRAIVRAMLLVHSRDFRRRFGPDILDAVGRDLEEAGRDGVPAVASTALRAIVDALFGLRVRSGDARNTLTSQALATWWRGTAQDVRFGSRTLRREWSFSLAVIATLALGIGVNAAMFGVVDRLVLRGPDHVRDQERVRRVIRIRHSPGMDVEHTGWFPYAAYDTFRQHAQSFEQVAAYSVVERTTVLGQGLEARQITRGEATASLFPLLGVAPAAGRFYTEREDDTAQPEHVVVLGDSLWNSEFGRRPDVVGQSVLLDNVSYTVVGVAPKGFTGPDLVPVDVWMPESLLGRNRLFPSWTTGWNGSWLSLVVRLKPDVSPEQADAEATALFRQAYVGSDDVKRSSTLSVRSLRSDRNGEEPLESRVSTWLLAMSGIVLLVACANVVNLLLARAIQRSREVATRLAIGAGRGRIVRLLVVEVVMLAAVGGGAGVAIAYALGAYIQTQLLPSVDWTGGPVDWRVLGVCALVSIVLGLAVGLLPALRSTAADISTSLRSSARGGGATRSRTRTALTIAQAALSTALLIGAGLFVASLERVRAMDLGLQPDRVLTIGVRRAGIAPGTAEDDRKREAARRATFYRDVVDQLAGRPDVESASLTLGLPFWTAFGNSIEVPGRDTIPQLKGGGPYLSAVTPDYFKTVGTRIVRGRGFTSADRAGSARVSIVNETMARVLWPGDDAIGKCFRIGDWPGCAEVVGIAADTRRFQLREDEAMSFYIPFGQEQNIGGTTLLVRPRGDATAVIPAMRQLLMGLDPSITFVDIARLQDRVEPQVRPWMLGATMFSLMGVLALVVAAVGLYSVISYLVTHRTQEIGVRMALGAAPAQVAQLFLRGGLALAVAGVAIGFAAALAASRFVEPLLFDTSSRDPRVFLAVAAALLTVALVAAVVPAARASRVNPAEAMRQE